ncbi:glutathione S-transferase family protein [uncultured Methylibium sp.]|uniref:glutathione S-transferase family protein n=1 Tax=uncultured Methylibium sp. TaxID=381093 RepID=UPI0025F4245C|nr:glutathione S-transferase family protein [uncultured Methylibium sp.]
MQLVIGNKNYSSWSMRPWVLMRQAGIAFEEVLLRFDGFAPDSRFQRELAAYTPARRVPVLIDGDGDGDGDGAFSVWDTLAIAEYLAEKFPQARLWPDDVRARARARSVCAEMHAGFPALRSHCPMNVEASLPEVGARLMREQPAVGTDLERIVALWSELLQQHGGPLLFGRFTIADAYFAPVCSRLRTYALPVPPRIAAYVEAVHALPGVQAWVKDALEEREFLDFEEPYRSSR